MRDTSVVFFLNAARPTADLHQYSVSGSDTDGDDGDDDVLLANVETPQGERLPLTIAEWEARETAKLKSGSKQNSRHIREVAGVPARLDDIDPFLHLVNVDIIPFIKSLPARFENIQLLLTHSRAGVASLPAASYAERNSAAGVISTKGNVSLSTAEISELVTLRLNKEFFGVLCEILMKLSELATTSAADGTSSEPAVFLLDEDE